MFHNNVFFCSLTYIDLCSHFLPNSSFKTSAEGMHHSGCNLVNSWKPWTVYSYNGILWNNTQCLHSVIVLCHVKTRWHYFLAQKKISLKRLIPSLPINTAHYVITFRIQQIWRKERVCWGSFWMRNGKMLEHPSRPSSYGDVISQGIQITFNSLLMHF